MRQHAHVVLTLCAALAGGTARADVNVLDDQMVIGGVCVGNDCATDGSEMWRNGNTSTGSGEVKLSGVYNLLTFDDTSVVVPYATRSWQLRVNNAWPGLGFEGDDVDLFEIIDLDAATAPFRIFGPAPDDALVIDSSGHVGIGTATPQTGLHLNNSNSGAGGILRFEDNVFGTRSWNVSGWANYFYVQDLTSSTTPFFVAAGAPSNALGILPNGNVGLNTPFPTADKQLHVYGNSDEGGAANNTQILVQNVDDTTRARRMIEVINNGAPQMVYTDSSLGRSWQINPKNNGFVVARVGYGGEALTINEDGRLILRNGAAPVHFNMLANGNLTITGTLTQGSDVNSKEDIAPVEGAQVLARLDALPVSEWTYIADDSNARHVGPMAQDFHAAFGLGDDPTRLAPGDVAGVALAAAKALRAENAELREQLAAQDALLRTLAERLSRVESAGNVASAR